jgi:PqqD family protein of HPr-rel-A system
MKWFVAPTVDLKWRCWDDELVVYHVQSGDTHLLNPLAGHILQSLQLHAQSADELVASAARTFELEPDDQLTRQIQQCLEQFDEVGLIEPTPQEQKQTACKSEVKPNETAHASKGPVTS